MSLLESEEKFRLIAENTSDGIIQFAADSSINYVSPAYLKQLGYSEAQELTRTPDLIYAIIHPQDRDTLFARIYAAIEAQAGDLLYSYRVKHQAGHYIWREDHAQFKYTASGSYAGCTVICRDITERQQLHEALQGESRKALRLIQDLSKHQTELTDARQQLRQLAFQNELDREAQLKHIAREVHDELGQLLTALHMDMSLLQMRFGVLDPALATQVNGSKTLIDRAMAAVRRVAANLQPPELDLGLVPAIEYLCNEFTQHASVACVFTVTTPDIVLDEARAVVIFRIVQESLTNVARYAQASQVCITLGLKEQQLGLEIRDNGQGFDMAAVAARQTLGLLGMRERALALQGQLNVISSPGQGTTVEVSIPFNPEPAGTTP